MFIQALLHVLGYDLWFYASHRALHTRRFWWIHARHHERVSGLRWLDAYHGHWIETAVQLLGFFLPAAFGLWSWPVAAVTAALINVRGLARHDERMTWLIGTHHLQHHARPKWNFGEPWLDAMFGTRAKPRALPTCLPGGRIGTLQSSGRMVLSPPCHPIPKRVPAPSR